MNRKYFMIGFLIVVFMLTTWTSVSIANGYTLPRWFLSRGGGSSAGGGYSLNGTLGQHDTGRMSSGDFTLDGGFWNLDIIPTVEPPLTKIYLPLLLK